MSDDNNQTNETFDWVQQVMNRSKDVDQGLINSYTSNKAIEEPAYTYLIIFYGILITFGALGNTLVIIAVVRKPAMRTPRNLFILNLAIADWLLCTVTMPLTLMEILAQYFPLGNSPFLCKTIGAMQATSIFVSTISITAIALDRYQVIVYPTRESLQLCGATVILFVIWTVAFLLASPLLISKSLSHHVVELESTTLIVNFCYEDWPVQHGRAFYSIFSLIFQYTLPIIIVSVAYIRISYKLRYRFAAGFVSSDDNTNRNRRELRGRRLQKTNILLGSIAIIFCISWIPLNLYNLLADFSLTTSFSTQQARICYAICHMIGMSSACSNPILYGCLNENFWKEFKEILCRASPSDQPTKEEPRKLSLRQQCQKVLGRPKPDLVTNANEYQPCNTASSDTTVITKS
ncbi:neuropeptide F receptor-like [Aethina tumida]|uniref:neuropeptide F receptor-like n=1 Tax=Aethina tumida TaxID=116153 RepID=UPI00096AF08E|nr:neuropeptide F receptor-like [Aethina tumida]